MKRNHQLTRLLFISLVLCLVFLAFQPVSGQTANKFFISEMDCSAFPTISIVVRGVDADGKVIDANSLSGNFDLYENDQKIEGLKSIGSVDGPKYVAFSFDLGKLSNLDKYDASIREALNLFANNYFNDNLDTVEIVSHTRDNDTQQINSVLPPVHLKNDFIDAVDSLDLNPSNLELKGFQGLNDLFESLEGLDPGRYSMAIIHFSRRVEGITPKYTISKALEDATTLGGRMASANIRAYVIDTESTADYSVNSFRTLATQSRGEYIVFDGDARSLTSVFTQIKSNGQAYQFQFRAKKINATYKLTPAGVSIANPSDIQQCADAPEVTQPVVQITNPSGENPTRSLKSGETKIQIGGTLTDWPLDGSRRLSRVELWVDGALADSQDFPPDFSGATFTLNLDTSQRQIEEPTTFRVQVKAIDEFGLTGSSPEIDLMILPYQPTQEPVARPISGITPPPSATCQNNPFTPKCILEWVLARLIWVILIILVVVLIILFNTNRKLKSLASPARQALSGVFEQVRKTLLGGTSIRQEAIAYLHVLVARADRAGGKIEIYNNRTSLGRDPKVTDVQLYQLDDESSVSSLHCTIFYDQGKFYITDDNSSNGTYVDGQRLASNEPYELQNGAEIILGDIYREGAKLRFEIATAGVAEPEAAELEMESDFHVDIPVEGAPSVSEAVQPEEDDYRKTVPGYREAADAGGSTDIFSEPSPVEPESIPQPGPAKKPALAKKDKKDWMDSLE